MAERRQRDGAYQKGLRLNDGDQSPPRCELDFRLMAKVAEDAEDDRQRARIGGAEALARVGID